MDVISMDIRLKLIEKGYRNIAVQQQLSPAWTTDWMTEEGRKKLQAFGIAPPNPKQQFCISDMFRDEAVQCRNASRTIPKLSASLAPRPVRPCTVASPAKRHLIILNAINFVAHIICFYVVYTF
jgi:metal-sulfur cluster biosynthetic enzyme